MHISYCLTAEDFVNFQEYYMKKKSPIAGCLQPLISTLLVCNILFGIYLYLTQGVTTYTYVTLICILLLGLFLVFRGQGRKNLLKAAKQIEKDKPGAFGNMTMDFSQKGIDIHSSTQNKFLTWGDVDKYEENKDYIFLFSKSGMVYIIPKRDISFSTEEMTAYMQEIFTSEN